MRERRQPDDDPLEIEMKLIRLHEREVEAVEDERSEAQQARLWLICFFVISFVAATPLITALVSQHPVSIWANLASALAGLFALVYGAYQYWHRTADAKRFYAAEQRRLKLKREILEHRLDHGGRLG